MRLIDADALPEYTGYALSANEVAMAVEDAPTIDAVEVVRCRDCKWYDKHDKRCKVWNHGVLSIGYCYRGEEREDETVD